MAIQGLITLRGRHGPIDTMERLIAAATDPGATILARIDHATAAAAAGLQLRPTEVATCGDPRAGMPLTRTSQTIAIDLPVRALVWQDEAGTTELSYDDPA